MPRSHPGPGPPYRCTRSPAQHPHVLITRSPAFTSAVTPSDAQAAGLDKRVTTWGHHYSVIQSSVTALKIFCFLSFFFGVCITNYFDHKQDIQILPSIATDP